MLRNLLVNGFTDERFSGGTMQKPIFLAILALFGLLYPLQSAFCQQLLSEKRVYADRGDYADIDNPQCRVRGQDNASNLIVGILSGKIPNIPQTIGVVFELALPTVQNLVAQTTSGVVSQIIAPNRYATCVSVAYKIPPGVTITDIQGFTDEGPCTQVDRQFRKCAAGWSAWTWANQNGYIVGTFKNWSHDRARNATLKVFGTTPPAQAAAPRWPQSHTVVKGDSLSKIAEAVYGKQN